MVKKTTTMVQPHHIRTFFASLLGTIGVLLILLSILVVWLNRTLTDTNTFSATVAPLVTKPAIQNFVTQKVTDQLLQNVSPQNIAGTLLTPDQINGKTDQQLTALIRPIITSSVSSIVQSPAFAQQWKDVTRSAHQQFISQLQGSSTQLTIDLSPAVADVNNDLKQTKLSAVSNHISVKPGTGKLNLKGGGIDKAHHFYKLFQSGTLAIVGLTIVLVGASIALSVHHRKTIRRIAFTTGLGALLLALLLAAPSFIKVGGDSTQSAAAIAFAQVLFHNLQLTCFIVAAVGIVSAVSSKLYSKHHTSA